MVKPLRDASIVSEIRELILIVPLKSFFTTESYYIIALKKVVERDESQNLLFL
jgi:hypothetical protein